MSRGRLKLFIAGAIIIAGVSYLMVKGIKGTTVYYYTLSELMANPALNAEGVRVSATVAPGSIKKDPSTMSVDFIMVDGAARIPVHYVGIIPDTFKDKSQVVVEGSLNPQRSAFQAHTLLAKCPSKYESQFNTETGREHQKKYGIQTDFREATR
ncbi:MAG TPA: cytochrome c maturation protein CcmE [Acidobacteriota bacterium]